MFKDLFVVGLSWRTAPVSVREKLAYRDDELVEALDQLLSSPDIDEAIIVSTCNRVEIYGSTPPAQSASVEAATAEARAFLSRSRGVDAESLSDQLYEHVQLEAVRHVFRVASALDSMVVGESQILGQVKGAYGFASKAAATGQMLNRCMQQAFTVAKRVRTETGISRGAANVSSVAVELAKHVFDDLGGKTVLVIGAGKMSVLAARHLHASGAAEIVVTNRSEQKAEELAAEIDGVAEPWEDLRELLTEADVVISSTASKQPVLTKKLMKSVVKARRYRRLVIVDIAVPRDVDRAVGDLDGVFLFDIDDLQTIVAENLKERTREADAADEIIATEVVAFEHWQRSQKVVPTIRDLRKHFADVAADELAKHIDSLKNGEPLNNGESLEHIEKATERLLNRVINKLLHTPMAALKSEGDVETRVEVTRQLFDLRDDDEPRGGE